MGALGTSGDVKIWEDSSGKWAIILHGDGRATVNRDHPRFSEALDLIEINIRECDARGDVAHADHWRRARSAAETPRYSNITADIVRGS